MKKREAMHASSLENTLAEEGILTFSIVGTSMLPLLKQERDLFTVEKKTSARCKPGDVVLYRRAKIRYHSAGTEDESREKRTMQYVLHRVIAVQEGEYIILGDNCIRKEYGITDKDILGVMVGFIRKGTSHSADEFGYRMYSTIFVTFCDQRILATKMFRMCRQSLKRLLR